MAAAYFSGGAGLERTIMANSTAFNRYGIVQRMLRDVSGRDLSVTLFGRTLPLPFLLAPPGVLEMAHRQADIAAARAAASSGIPFITSSQASRTMEALCLGAATVLIGRPYVYGLALAGEAGVADVIADLAAELDLTMGLSGRRTASELDRDVIHRAPGWN